MSAGDNFDEVINKYAEDMFLQTQHPRFFWGVALQLKTASAFLFQHPVIESIFIEPSAKLLYALAFENVLKGLILSKTPALASNKSLHRDLMGHDLVALAKKADTFLNDCQFSALRQLTIQTVWAGRYPMPLRAADLVKNGAEEIMAAAGFNWEEERAVLDDTFALLLDQLTKSL